MAKKVSAGQKANQENFKKATDIAKALHAKNPKKKYTDCVKEAWKQIKAGK
jgi:hypothetical protein